MTESVIQRYKPGDEHGLNALYNEVFDADRTLDEWRWKYAQGPRAQMNLTAVLKHSGQIVGQYSSLTLDMTYRGQTVTGVQPMDIAILPGYRGRGQIESMFKAWASIVCTAGVAFAFGFPNTPHYRVGKRLLRYSDVGAVTLFRCPVNPALALYKLTGRSGALAPTRRLASWLYHHLRRLRPIATDLAIEELDHFDERFDTFWNRVNSMYPIIVARTRSYLNWRYVERPGAAYTIYATHRDGSVRGYTVLALREHSVVEGVIADILADDASTTRVLLEAAIVHFLTIGVDVISAWALPESGHLGEALRRAGFVERGMAAPLVCMAFDLEIVDEEFLCDPRNWYITMGDSDGV
jgi:hypothetical protein